MESPRARPPLVHLRDTAMLSEPPCANDGNHIQTKFSVGQRPPSFLFGMISHMIAWACRSGTVTNDDRELPECLQGHHLPSAVIRHPQPVSALFTDLPKRRQGGRLLRFGSGAFVAPLLYSCFQKSQLFHFSLHQMSRRVCRSAKKMAIF